MHATMQERINHYRADPQYAANANAKYAELLARSAADEKFRKKLLTDPRAALAEFTGHEIPDSVNIVFLENDADATIVLPPVTARHVELSEQDLESVSGGTGWDVLTDVIIAGIVLYDAAKTYVQSQIPQVP